MALQAELFRGDAKLEAAATIDSGHVTPGASGEHVRKIQVALIRLDGAKITADGIYGPRTAAAVLAYKQKRNLVNRNYQTSADNIAGKMTIASMDAELCKWTPKEGIKLRVVSPVPDSYDHTPHVITKPAAGGGGGAMLAFSFSPALYGPPSFSSGPIVSLNIGQTAVVEVKNGAGGTIMTGDPKIAALRDAGNHNAAMIKITTDPQTIVIAGLHRGGAVIIVDTASAPPLSLPQSMFRASLTVSVKEARSTPYVPTMTQHNHRPTGQWSALLKAIDQPSDTVAGVRCTRCARLAPIR